MFKYVTYPALHLKIACCMEVCRYQKRICNVPLHRLVCLCLFLVLFAPTELKVRARMYSLHVAWQPPPNSSHISGYKLQYRELEPVPKEDRPAIQPIKLRKRSKHYEITGLGRWCHQRAKAELYSVCVIIRQEWLHWITSVMWSVNPKFCFSEKLSYNEKVRFLFSQKIIHSKTNLHSC